MGSNALLRRFFALPPPLRRRLWTSSTATTASSTKPDIYNVVCIGGGPAGLSLVSALQSQDSTRGLRIALIDSQDITSSRQASNAGDYSNRCSSLTPSSVRFLKQIGAWDDVRKERTQSYHAMDVWDGVSGSKVHFDSLDQQGAGLLDVIGEMVPGSRWRGSRRKYEVGSEGEGEGAAVATMCENGNLTAALLQRLRELQQNDGLKMMDKTKVESIDLGPRSEDEKSLDLSQWPIVTTSQGQLAARLLVGADGANSPVRRFADIPSYGWDYNQHGVVATLSLSHDHTPEDLRTAYQRFLPTGPIALLPLPGNKASLVWSTSPQHAARLKALTPPDFVSMANAAFRLMPVDINYLLSPFSTDSSITEEVSWRSSSTSPSQTGLPKAFPHITAVQEGSIASFPLRMRHASTYTGHRIALIGDAAHTIHPLAGQGLNLGLADAEALAKTIANGVEHGMDIGSCWCLDGYNSERWAANNAMLGVVEKLQKLYSAGSGPVVWGRSLGLELVDRLGGLKGGLMGVAAGR